MLFSKSPHQEVKAGLKPLFPRLWRYCLVMTGSADQAADLAQTTCLKALEKSEQFTSGTHLDRWVFRIAKNLWFNELRAQAVRQGGGLQSVDEAEIDDRLSSSESTSLNKDMLKGVLSLPEAQRIVVAMVYIEGYSYRESADMLEIPIGTVMSRLAAARAKLARYFKHYQSDVV